MTANLSLRGLTLLRSLQRTLQLVVEHEKAAPDEVEMIETMLAAHLRSRRPLALTQAGVP